MAHANASPSGSGIAPFFPVTSTAAGIYLPVHIFLFLFKLPFFVTVATTYFLFLQWFPLGSLLKKAILWMILGIPGIWWIDLQIDGVKKGSLAKKHEGRVPQPSNVIASSFTSPIDSLYLAAIFDPIFTVSYPHTRQVQEISLLSAILRALCKPQEHPPKGAQMTDLKTLLIEHPQRVIVVFPECTTTNGKGILPFSPSLLTTPPWNQDISRQPSIHATRRYNTSTWTIFVIFMESTFSTNALYSSQNCRGRL